MDSSRQYPSSRPRPRRRRARAARPRRGAWLAAALALGLLARAAADDQHAYQDRGGHAEGIGALPTDGDDITLISARATPVGGPEDRIPERLRLRFVLPRGQRPATVQVGVRELQDRFDYRLDRVRPSAPWQPGQVNAFRWPTRTVLKSLYGRGLQTAELGVLVQMGAGEAAAGFQRVSPAVLSGEEWPVEIANYLFSFRTRVPARVTCVLEPSGSASAIWGQTFKRVLNGHSYSCQVPFPPLPAGDYTLRIEGWELATNAPLQKREIRFYHDPSLQ